MINNTCEELYDLERMNFVEWYRTATPEDFAVAQENNAAKLEELKNKYASEVAIIDAIRGAENN